MVEEVVWSARQQRHDSKVSDLASDLVTIPYEEESQLGFALEYRQAAPGGFCGQRRMFVIKEDIESANRDGWGKNWEKIKVPPGYD